jgi:hypothetical protein
MFAIKLILGFHELIEFLPFRSQIPFLVSHFAVNILSRDIQEGQVRQNIIYLTEAAAPREQMTIRMVSDRFISSPIHASVPRVLYRAVRSDA